MELSETLDVHLVEDRTFPWRFGLARCAPREGRVDDAAFLHQRRAVTLIVGQILVGVIEPVTEQLRSPAQLSNHLLGVGIEHELVRIESMARVGRI